MMKSGTNRMMMPPKTRCPGCDRRLGGKNPPGMAVWLHTPREDHWFCYCRKCAPKGPDIDFAIAAEKRVLAEPARYTDPSFWLYATRTEGGTC